MSLSVTGKGDRPWRFKPGQSGNPKGKPPGPPKEFKDLVKEYTPKALDALEAALNSKGERVPAAMGLLAYAHGRPVQPTEFTGTVIHALMAMPLDQRLERAHALIARAQALIAAQATIDIEPDEPNEPPGAGQ